MYIGPTSRRHSPVKMDSQKFTSPLIQGNQKQKRNAEEDIFSPVPVSNTSTNTHTPIQKII